MSKRPKVGLLYTPDAWRNASARARRRSIAMTTLIVGPLILLLVLLIMGLRAGAGL